MPTFYAVIHSQTPRAERFLGKSSHYVNAYTTAYRRQVKIQRIALSATGCMIGTGGSTNEVTKVEGSERTPLEWLIRLIKGMSDEKKKELLNVMGISYRLLPKDPFELTLEEMRLSDVTDEEGRKRIARRGVRNIEVAVLAVLKEHPKDLILTK